MRLEALIAIRYLFADKEKSVVHTISWISLIGLAVCTAALIVILSVYNGIGELTSKLFATFDPELIVEPSHGKTFCATDLDIDGIDGIATTSQIVNETAWLTYGDRQAIVTLRGVDDRYVQITGIDTLLHEGCYTLNMVNNEIYGLVVGGEIWCNLGMQLHSNTPATIYIPKRGTSAIGFSLDEAFNIGYAYPVANFFIQQDIDGHYVICDIDMVRKLTNYGPNECTSMAIKLKPHIDAQKVKRLIIEANADDTYIVKDRYNQQPLYFKIFRSERLGIYLILSLIVLISTLSLVSSLSLLVINKRDDIFTLHSMGMQERQIRYGFITEGMLICVIAVVTGLLIGFIVCLLQQQFGIIRMGDGNFVVNAFPVAMRGIDFLLTFLLVTTLGGIAVALSVGHRRL